MKCIHLMVAYWRTVQNYLNTAKGHHDSRDYLRAVIIITIVSLALMFVINLGEHE